MTDICRECHHEFIVPVSGSDGFCSDACERIYDLGVKTCRYCASEFSELEREPYDQYCSDDCKSTHATRELLFSSTPEQFGQAALDSATETKRQEFMRMIHVMSNLGEMSRKDYENAMSFAQSADITTLNAIVEKLIASIHGVKTGSL
jgi:hypothetical protein